MWDELHIPVEMAFFFTSSQTGRVAAFYPGPMGATESLLELRAWDALAAANPVLAEDGAGRRGAAREPSARSTIQLVGADRRVLLARGHDPDPLAGSHRRQAGVARDRRVLRAPRSQVTNNVSGCGRRPKGAEVTNIKLGKPDVTPDAPSHTPGIKAGNSPRQLRAPAGPPARRPRDRRALDRGQREPEESDRPADAEHSTALVEALSVGRHQTTGNAGPGGGAGARLRDRERPARSSTRLCRRCVSGCGSAAQPITASGRSCSTSRSRSRRGGGRTRTPARNGWPSCSGTRSAGARRCGHCSGRGRRRSCPASAARRWSTSTCRAPTISTSLRPSTSRGWRRASSRSSSSSVARSSTPPPRGCSRPYASAGRRRPSTGFR